MSDLSDDPRSLIAEAIEAGDDWEAWLDDLEQEPVETRVLDALKALAAAVPDERSAT